MIKNNKFTLAVTSIVILLPMLAGVFLWNRLPGTLTIHWGMDNAPNGFASKAFGVFGIPLILLTLHWLCVLVTEFDKRKANQSPAVQKLVLWIVPVLSVLTGAVIYAFSLGAAIRVDFWAMLLMGVLFAVIGNYLPKCKQNRTIGIKLPWTLSDSENWNKTHRLAGFLWIGCGAVMILAALVGWMWLAIGVLLAAIIVPTVYSYVYYRKNR